MVKEIVIGTGRKKIVTLVDDEIYESLRNGPITVTLKASFALATDGHVFLKFNMFLHRYVWEHFHGPIPDDMVIDHINEDMLDNRKDNLRLMSRQEHQSMHAKKQIRYKGRKYTKLNFHKYLELP